MLKRLIVPVLVFLCVYSVSLACTDFQVKAKDGSVVIGRSMEFPTELHSRIVAVPRGRQFTSIGDKGVKGLTWTNKYGFLGVEALNIKDGYVEGINEKGLAYDALMFTGAAYQPASPGKFVTIIDLCSWIMGNFATVDEARAALPSINVADIAIKEMHGQLDLHIALHDASGKNLVIEFIDGKVNVYDNPLGVMTNRPDFPWQMNNLRNYINLDAHDRKDRMLNGVKIEPAGVGSGMLGLPGDWTPPSRFVKIAYCVDAAQPAKDSAEAVNQAEHLLNAVDIPKGVIKENPAPFVRMEGFAQWVVIKDLTNRVLYYKTYDNTAWKKVDLKKFDLNPGAPQKAIPIDEKPLDAVDVSGELK
ncbi:MAG: choloylglycine hydrolase family protein [Syntrophorhabdaceae bacterium]|nr:choloylglycine hydrolase family protein [Syntrophorhabdaceae bacterium]